MITSVNIANNGLSSADEAPLSYFFRYAENYFNAVNDLEEVRLRGDLDQLTPAEIALQQYFAAAWLEMTRIQSEKYAPIIAQNKVGAEMLHRLGLADLIGTVAPGEDQGKRRRRATKRGV